MNSLDDSFEFFNYCKVGLSTYPLLYNKWYWSPLPSPPSRTSPLVAAAVIDNSTICASSKNGTYTFDISREVWSHTGSWVLPFHRAAEYVPELGLWFGLQAPGTWQNRLCALTFHPLPWRNLLLHPCMIGNTSISCLMSCCRWGVPW
uniref:Uncharacterized protein n=1 Tax=Aegilops tauschii subsp. strangulata TaxID=200361 RepID=A0A453KP42_AEGTS